MKPDCLICRGACCEDLVFPLPGLSSNTAELLAVRCGGTVQLTSTVKGFAINSRCSQLTPDGLCGVYENRPKICALYAAGGEACIEVLKRRRTPEQIAKITGATR